MLTASVVTQSGPVLLETFLRHYFSKKASKSSIAREELLFDEGQSVMTLYTTIFSSLISDIGPGRPSIRPRQDVFGNLDQVSTTLRRDDGHCQLDESAI